MHGTIAASFKRALFSPQADREERFGEVVRHLKASYGLKYVYCWHGLPAYWAGVMPGAPEMAAHAPRLVAAKPTPGVLEIEPSMAWNPAILAGLGAVDDPTALYRDMHSYLQARRLRGDALMCGTPAVRGCTAFCCFVVVTRAAVRRSDRFPLQIAAIALVQYMQCVSPVAPLPAVCCSLMLLANSTLSLTGLSRCHRSRAVWTASRWTARRAWGCWAMRWAAGRR